MGELAGDAQAVLELHLGLLEVPRSVRHEAEPVQHSRSISFVAAAAPRLAWADCAAFRASVSQPCSWYRWIAAYEQEALDKRLEEQDGRLRDAAAQVTGRTMQVRRQASKARGRDFV